MKLPLSILFVGHSLLRCASATLLEERTGCNGDNLLNALVNHIPDSYPFCSAYISIPTTSVVTVYTVSFRTTFSRTTIDLTN